MSYGCFYGFEYGISGCLDQPGAFQGYQPNSKQDSVFLSYANVTESLQGDLSQWGANLETDDVALYFDDATGERFGFPIEKSIEIEFCVGQNDVTQSLSLVPEALGVLIDGTTGIDTTFQLNGFNSNFGTGNDSVLVVIPYCEFPGSPGSFSSVSLSGSNGEEFLTSSVQGGSQRRTAVFTLTNPTRYSSGTIHLTTSQDFDKVAILAFILNNVDPESVGNIATRAGGFLFESSGSDPFITVPGSYVLTSFAADNIYTNHAPIDSTFIDIQGGPSLGFVYSTLSQLVTGSGLVDIDWDWEQIPPTLLDLGIAAAAWEPLIDNSHTLLRYGIATGTLDIDQSYKLSMMSGGILNAFQNGSVPIGSIMLPGFGTTSQNYSLMWSSYLNSETENDAAKLQHELWAKNLLTGEISASFFQSALPITASTNWQYTLGATTANGRNLFSGSIKRVRMSKWRHTSVEWDEDWHGVTEVPSSSCDPIIDQDRLMFDHTAGLQNSGAYMGPILQQEAQFRENSQRRLLSPLVNDVYRQRPHHPALAIKTGQFFTHAPEETEWDMSIQYLKWVELPRGVPFSKLRYRIHISTNEENVSVVPDDLGVRMYSLNRLPTLPPHVGTSAPRPSQVPLQYTFNEHIIRGADVTAHGVDSPLLSGTWLTGKINPMRLNTGNDVDDDTTILTLAFSGSDSSTSRFQVKAWCVWMCEENASDGQLPFSMNTR